MRVELDFMAVLSQWPLLATGVVWTLGLTAISSVVGGLVGTGFAWARASGPTWLRWVVGAYVELIRNTPFIVQLFFIFFGLPSLGLRLTPNGAALLALVVNFGAYGTEIIRAGIEAIHKGQVEAGTALEKVAFRLLRGSGGFQPPKCFSSSPSTKALGKAPLPGPSILNR